MRKIFVLSRKPQPTDLWTKVLRRLPSELIRVTEQHTTSRARGQCRTLCYLRRSVQNSRVVSRLPRVPECLLQLFHAEIPSFSNIEGHVSARSIMSKGVLFADKTYSLTVMMSPLTSATAMVRWTTLTLTRFCIREMRMTLLAIWSATLISRTRPKYSALGRSKFWCCDGCYAIVQLLSLPQRSLYPIARYLAGHGKESPCYPRLTPPSLSTISPYTKEKPNSYRDKKFYFAAYIGF